MTGSCRPWWRNCALDADSEILYIDKMEDSIAPLVPNISSIRELISSLELCHHKADRWIHNIIVAIGAGETDKGLGTRLSGQEHPAENVWQNAVAALSAWCAGSPTTNHDLLIESIPASQLLACLGKPTPLKIWQVQRVIEKIRSVIHWAQSSDDPTAQYEWILLNAGEYDVAYHNKCPEHYQEHEDFWHTTVHTIIHDTIDGDEAKLSLALAIDMLWPCHWRFVENLRIVLEAIGGKLNPYKPFAACGRNISLVPTRERMRLVSQTLGAFWRKRKRVKDVDEQILTMLGEATKEKRWLAASLDKTIRLQLDPPVELRAISALEWPTGKQQ